MHTLSLVVKYFAVDVYYYLYSSLYSIHCNCISDL